MLLWQCPDISYHSKKKHKPLHQHASCNTHWLPISADDAMLPANVPTKLSQPLTSPRLKLPKQRQGRSQKATGKWCPSCFEVFKHIEFGLFLHVPGVCKLLLQGFTQAVKSTAIKPTRGYRSQFYSLLHRRTTWSSRVTTVTHSRAMPVSAVSVTMLTFVQISSWCISRRCAFFCTCACECKRTESVRKAERNACWTLFLERVGPLARL